jgi:hypothetical protein
MKCRTYLWGRQKIHLIPWRTGPGDEILNELEPHNRIGRVWLIHILLGTFHKWDHPSLPIWKGVLSQTSVLSYGLHFALGNDLQQCSVLGLCIQRLLSSLADTFQPQRPSWATWLPTAESTNSQSQSHCDWRSVSLSVLVSSPVWGSWPDINYCLTVLVLSLGGRPLWRQDGSVVCQSVSSIRSTVSMYNFYILHVSHVIEYIYNKYRASVSPGSVQQNMPISGRFPITAV